MSTPRFQQACRALFVPEMGTEEVGPLLYHLVRMVRPLRALEVGMGFTTPFIALALAENRADCAAHGDDERALANREYYLREHDPHLVAIDDLGTRRSSAARVRGVLADLDLLGGVTIIEEPLAAAHERLSKDLLPFDFAWLDVWDKIHLFDRYWDLVEPAGGIVLLHYLAGYAEGEAFLRTARLRQQREADLEVLSFVEPHKLKQNSLTLVRRIDALPGGQIGAG